jgi:hypothetical protein
MMWLKLICQGGRRGASHHSEITNEVHLVIVSGSMCDLRPSDRTFRRLRQSERIDETSDSGHVLWRHTRKIKRFPFEVPDAYVQGYCHLPNTIRPSIPSDSSEGLAPRRLRSERIRLREQETVEQSRTVREVFRFAQPRVEPRYRCSKHRVRLNRMLRKKMSRHAKQFKDPAGLEHHGQSLDCAVRLELHTPAGHRPNGEHRRAGRIAFCAVDRHAIQTGEMKLQQTAQSRRDRLLEVGSRSQTALSVVTYEPAQSRMRKTCLEFNLQLFHLVLNGNRIGSTL